MGDSRWSVQTTPAQELRAPGDIGILAIDKKIGVEECAINGNIFDHGPAVKGGGGTMQLAGGIRQGLLEPVARRLRLLLAGAIARRCGTQLTT